VFFIAAACAEGDTLVRGALELRVKESDRLAVMAEGLVTLGVEHELLPDGLWIRGGDGFAGGTIDSHGDHRIAMAFAVASLRARAPIEIHNVANVATSFPGFLETARDAGLRITESG
jgi:3-phosphoshikimate 1-carboxyvinyltransferase